MSTVDAPSSHTTPQQNVVYHIYQHGNAGGQGVAFSVNNVPVSRYLQPVLLFLQWSFWVIYIAGAAQAGLYVRPKNHHHVRPFRSTE